jgi:hypothetical protein
LGIRAAVVRGLPAVVSAEDGGDRV